MKQISILGAGISGVSTSFHVGHDRCLLYEAKPHYGGHVFSFARDGFTWDDGPHVLFTDNEYVNQLFADGVDSQFEERKPEITNYYQGHWIDHPAQSNLYQIPEPLRSQCLESFLEARSKELTPPATYEEWLNQAFGKVFAKTFPAVYTRKYWAAEPADLGTDWIGERIFYPSVDDVKGGFKGPLGRSTHWVKRFRYPSRGGFISFLRKIAAGARIQYGKTLNQIHFGKRRMQFADGTHAEYETLVDTLPLPMLIGCSEDAPEKVREAAKQLKTTRFWLFDFGARHPSKLTQQWAYVYDANKITTRISITENFSPHNSPPGCTGMSIEVCGSDYKELPADKDALAKKIREELVEMGMLESIDAVISTNIRYVPFGQVIYDHNRKGALQIVNEFLDRVGVVRVGRYSEWRYAMTHDCVLKARHEAANL
ncbi:MAG: FAD-dependent oxidoreductase [Candidatus Acidiferrales bacterium]